MKTDIEKPFIEAFGDGGALSLCIAAIAYKYDLCYPDYLFRMKSRVIDKQVYEEKLSAMIKEVDVAFIRNMKFDVGCSLDIEIRNNLNECKTTEDKEHYLYGLLFHFKPLSRTRYPELMASPGTANVISERQMKNRLEVKERFEEVLLDYNSDDESEKLYRMLSQQAISFADMLDGICLCSKIDLLSLQRKYDVYLKDERYVSSLVDYIGSEELVQKLIDALPKQGQLLPSDEAIDTRDTSTVSKINPDYFKRKFKSDELEQLWKGLKNGGFIANSTDLSQLEYAFGGTMPDETKEPPKPINWTKPLNMLVYMLTLPKIGVDKQSGKWIATGKCFRIYGEKITGNLKATAHKVNHGQPPSGSGELDTIVNNAIPDN